MQNETTLRIEFSPLFESKLRKLPFKIITAFEEAIDLFWENPHHQGLRRHFLREKFAGYESIDITDDYRAVFKEIKTGNLVVVKFYIIGTHKDLYEY